ncbi:hypothetical protein N9112_00155 [bacterium]|nr:hypothetical protein [bacterium]
MITFSTNVKALMDKPSFEHFYLIDMADGLLRITDHAYAITLSDARTFQKTDELLEIERPKFSTVVDREHYKILLADPGFSQGALADLGIIGEIIEIRVGFVDTSTGLPLTALADTVSIYKGLVDTTAYRMTQDEVVLEITCASPMADLDQINKMVLSKDDVTSRNPADTCCDQLYEGSGGIALKWGKE